MAAGLALMTWAAALAGALISYLYDPDTSSNRSLRGYLRYCFPAHIAFHRSSKLDYGFAAIRALTFSFLLAPLILSAVLIATKVQGLLESSLGPTAHVGELSILSYAAIVALIMLAGDFAYYIAHLLQHRIPLLWEFHKVHHSAEVLNPLTSRRFHPVDEIMSQIFSAAGMGIVLGLFGYLFNIPAQALLDLTLAAYFVVELICLRHLRHSHIPLGFGPLDYLLVSPLQHQLHHSLAPEHLDRNLGTTFSIWDRLFGTFVKPAPWETYVQGLHSGNHERLQSVARLYCLPFVDAAARIRASWRPARGRAIEPVTPPLQPLRKDEPVQLS
jgi:sterol desaturase/sphingolipid hydroxylase (fatty acid hydroxylase superfamily)